MDRYCPECGTGFEPKCNVHPHGRTLRLPKDYPFDAECKTCKLHTEETLKELGIKVALDIERQVMERMFG